VWVVAADMVACAAVAGDGEQLTALERRLAGDALPHTVRPAVLAALWQGRLTTDMTRTLSGSSIVWRPR
jgi:hypothetical protein